MRSWMLRLAACVAVGWMASPASAAKPNVLLILADDLGWSDLGCYGGEIRTPNLDALAKDGLRFSRFYNSARCSPSRISILTGREPHAAGFADLNGKVGPNNVFIPEALKPAGYATFMVGKWHLTNETKPIDRGFDEFYGMLGGFNTCWVEKPSYTRWPKDRTPRQYAEDGFYSTDVFADYALDFFKQARDEKKPWFMYLAFNAPHFPLHAYESDIAKYEALYLQGWDRLRQARFERLEQTKLLPPDVQLSVRGFVPQNKFNDQTGWANKHNPAWDSLPDDRRKDLARRMAVYAAMVDRMDQAIGRVVTDLKANSEFDNTVIFFLSDNGACAEWDPWGFDKNSGPQNVLHTGDDLKTVGAKGSYVSYGSGWANLSNTPFSLYKHYATEGGTRTPLIVHWPAGLKTSSGQVVDYPGHMSDLLPTILDLVGTKYPSTNAKGDPSGELAGMSLAPILNGSTLSPRVICIEHEGNRSIAQGEWKLVMQNQGEWELYNIAADPGETTNLAKERPELIAPLAAKYEAWAKKNDVPQAPKDKR